MKSAIIERFGSGVLTLLLIWGASILPVQAQMNQVKPISIGTDAPMTDVDLETTDGEMTTLQASAMEKGLVVMFTCNTCPYVKAWEDRFNEVSQMAKEQGIGFIALNPNTKYRDKGDSMDDMKKRAQDYNYQFTYALDKNNQLADAYGATRTPEIFLFNSDMKLVYHGAIDDNYKSKADVQKTYLKDALMALGNGNDIMPKTTKSLGCSIKRVR
ncbi:MAG: thioredoxin family protein [Bacteroidota bacterium]